MIKELLSLNDCTGSEDSGIKRFGDAWEPTPMFV